MAIGGILGLAGTPLPGVEAGILASVLILGAMIALATRFPLAAGITLVAAFAIFHGHAHGTEIPQTASALGYGLGFCTATALLHATGIALPLALRRLAGENQTTWTRYAGATITLAGVILLLA
jgi:urease accessory protein